MIPILGEVGYQSLAMLLSTEQHHKDNVIDVYLVSDGGYVAPALAMYDYMRGRNFRVTASGGCSSAAVVILQGGKTRLATPNTVFYLHGVMFEDAGEMFEGKKNEIENIVRNLFVQRIGEKNYDQALDKAVLTTDDALKYNLIDKVVEFDDARRVD